MATFARHANYDRSPGTTWQVPWDQQRNAWDQTIDILQDLVWDWFYSLEWPRSNFYGDPSSVGTNYIFTQKQWGILTPWHGITQRWGISGVTRDVNGTPIGNVICRLFLTSDNTLQDTATSDANGNFSIYTPSTASHYIVAYKTGTPDIEGTTVNTLTGI